MKPPLIILIAIMVCILGFLVIYSQQHETISVAAPGHGVSGGYGSAPASGGYGSSSAAAAPASGGYGAAPAAASGGYGAPAPAAGGYGAPAPAAAGSGK